MEQLEGEDKDEDREETVEEKIDRLGKEIQDLEKEVARILSSLPPITTTSRTGTAAKIEACHQRERYGAGAPT